MKEDFDQHRKRNIQTISKSIITPNAADAGQSGRVT